MSDPSAAVTIFHNPACGNPPDRLRQKGTPYEELGLGAEHWSDSQLIDQMLQHPILINRPIVITPRGVKLCRLSEVVLELLPARKGEPEC